MKYIVIDRRQSEEWTEEFDNKEEAIKYAEREWSRMHPLDKKHCLAFYVLESVNPDEEAPDHYDGNPILELK